MMRDLEQDRRYANTLARGLKILRAFRPSDNGLGNLEISERTGIPRSTVSRLTFTLCALGYLTHGRHFDKYRLGPAALALGNIASAAFGFVTVAAPIMQELANKVNALVGVAIQDDGTMLIVKTWRPEGSGAIWLDVGYRMPVLTSSSGVAYLGALTQEEREKLEALLPEEGAEICEEVWQHQSAQLRRVGYACVAEDMRYSRAIHAVATPFRPSEIGEPVSIFCGANVDDLSTEQMHVEVGPELVKAVNRLKLLTGHAVSAVASA
ncbi:transcriptional regulator, IclR family [Ruegeria sp. TM1040]|nr:IclR family transcriptional regulator [Ruegeria sp. TM1040]ABF63095.1 transcriptional regulator, IclR family [Ruegeria sp. TM1040]MDF9304608.1 IclR family transcriptional regulator [Tritonibacter mobilis]